MSSAEQMISTAHPFLIISIFAGQKKRDGSLQASGLADIFPAIDCATLGLPHYDRTKLRRLDLLDDSELLPEYRDQMTYPCSFYHKR